MEPNFRDQIANLSVGTATYFCPPSKAYLAPHEKPLFHVISKSDTSFQIVCYDEKLSLDITSIRFTNNISSNMVIIPAVNVIEYLFK